VHASRHRLIAVEGVIGAGKTSLAQRLVAHYGAEGIFERPDDNPFLARYYAEGAQYALATQLFFLFQRIEQMRELRQLDLFRRSSVADFLLDKDPLFAQLTLSPEELALYNKIFAALKPQAPRPDLVIFLQAPVSVLQDRIERRGRPYERGLAEPAMSGYLTALTDAYNRFFYHYTEAPLLIVNAEHFDFVQRADHLTVLIERIEALRGGREYLNTDET
jgi:deoxyguanosine kinase